MSQFYGDNPLHLVLMSVYLARQESARDCLYQSTVLLIYISAVCGLVLLI